MEVGVVRDCGLLKIRLMLVISLLLLVPLAVLSNVTHSMVLAMEAYHMLYNVMTLVGCLLAVRLASRGGSAKNTFGWRRLEVLVVVTSLLFLAALSFSVTVEAIQSIVHAGHQDAIHHPLYIMGCAAAVLLGNLLCYLLIGGYTNLQSTFLTSESMAAPETDKLPPKPLGAAAQPGSSAARSVSAATPFSPYSATARLWLHFLRDIGGTLLVVACAAVAHGCRHWLVQYLDPVLAIISVVIMMATSGPLLRSCCLILLQNMPDTFDAELFCTRLLQRCPAVEDVHELHVWQLTPGSHVGTAHVVLSGPCQFAEAVRSVTAFFAEHDIEHVTLQPEFSGVGGAVGRCLLPCKGGACEAARCCRMPPPPPLIRVTPPSQASLAERAGSAGSPAAAVKSTCVETSAKEAAATGTATEPAAAVVGSADDPRPETKEAGSGDAASVADH